MAEREREHQQRIARLEQASAEWQREQERLEAELATRKREQQRLEEELASSAEARERARQLAEPVASRSKRAPVAAQADSQGPRNLVLVAAPDAGPVPGGSTAFERLPEATRAMHKAGVTPATQQWLLRQGYAVAVSQDDKPEPAAKSGKRR